MKKLYDELAYKISQETTQKYSTSFSLGIKAIDKHLRPAIYAIYGYVRLADEIVDSFHGFDQELLLNDFEKNTFEALEKGISLNPILQSFQDTVKLYGIDQQLIHQFLHSMRMDLNKVEYDLDRYQEYILGSAEVVGLMCLHVFVEGQQEKFERLKPYAMKLGSAFQKVNFLRDLKADYETLGRSYFPEINLKQFNCEIKKSIEKDIEKDFQEAFIGIQQLPISSKFGVYLAYTYYRSLFQKIKNTAAKEIMQKRVRIPNTQKFYLLMSSYMNFQIARF